MCVSGYLFSSEQAVRLDLEFAEALAECGVKSFHAVDCAHGVEDFKGIAKEKRAELIKKLVNAIKRRAEFGVSVSASETDFGQVPPPGIWKSHAGPYPICVAQAIASIVAWCEKYDYRGKVSYFFEQGHRHQTITNEVIEQLRLSTTGREVLRYHSHTFADRRAVRPLQAADLLAYEWTRELIRGNDPTQRQPRRRMRRSLESLLDLSHRQQHIGSAQFAAFAAGGFRSIIDHMTQFHSVD
jgi:hypothetical protein